MYAGVYHYNLSSSPDVTIRNVLIHHIIRWFYISTMTWKKQRSKRVILFSCYTHMRIFVMVIHFKIVFCSDQEKCKFHAQMS